MSCPPTSPTGWEFRRLQRAAEPARLSARWPTPAPPRTTQRERGDRQRTDSAFGGGGDDVTRDQWDAQTAEIARLMGVADDEDAAIQQLEADLAAIRRVHVA